MNTMHSSDTLVDDSLNGKRLYGKEEIVADRVTKDLVAKTTYKSKAISLLGRFIKRTIDIIGSIFGILALAPITLFVLLSNKKTKDKDPIIFTQNRIGQNGRLFKMYKYRTMVVGADEILEKYLAENEDARIEYKTNKKLKKDPRITPSGKFLRRTSLDEFPQFLNVFKGEMSLVGPRPYLEREIPDMGKAYEYIIKCKPGVTGLWQISGRNDVTFNERLDIELRYYESRTIIGDIKILFKTFCKVFKCKGAK